MYSTDSMLPMLMRRPKPFAMQVPTHFPASAKFDGQDRADVSAGLAYVIVCQSIVNMRIKSTQVLDASDASRKLAAATATCKGHQQHVPCRRWTLSSRKGLQYEMAYFNSGLPRVSCAPVDNRGRKWRNAWLNDRVLAVGSAR